MTLIIPKGRGRREEDSGGRDGQEPERPRQPGVPRAVQEHSRDAKVVGRREGASINDLRQLSAYFYRPLSGGRSRTHFVTKSLSKRQMSHLEAQDAKSVQSKDV